MDIQLEYNSTGAVIGGNFFPQYNPSNAAAYLFLALFALTTIAHIILLFVWRAKWFVPLIVGGIMETFGYYARAMAHNNTHHFGWWIMQLFLIMVAPPLISATVYTTLARLITTLDARSNALMGPRTTTAIFVTADIVALLSQLVGIGLQASTDPNTQETGEKITIAGLAYQLVLSVVFISSIIVFDRRNTRSPTLKSGNPTALHWRRYVLALYLASGAILLRNIVRTAEYAQGASSAVSRYEAFIYVFDATLMWAAMLVFSILHPGRLRKALRMVYKSKGTDAESKAATKQHKQARSPSLHEGDATEC